MTNHTLLPVRAKLHVDHVHVDKFMCAIVLAHCAAVHDFYQGGRHVDLNINQITKHSALCNSSAIRASGFMFAIETLYLFACVSSSLQNLTDAPRLKPFCRRRPSDDVLLFSFYWFCCLIPYTVSVETLTLPTTPYAQFIDRIEETTIQTACDHK